MNGKAYTNPFSNLYLAEQFVRETEDTIKKGLLSPELFQVSEVESIITEPMNHFLIGVPGSGKTMALAFLRVECLAYINITKEIQKKFGSVWDLIDSGLWGVYHGLIMNEELLYPSDFKGYGLDKSQWTEIFGDFINYSYLRSMLRLLNQVIENPQHYIAQWLGLVNKETNISKAIKSFAKELSIPISYQRPEELLDWSEKRLKDYQRLIKESVRSKIKKYELPQSHFYKDIGYLPLKLVNKLREFKVLRSNQKILFIIDEYDQCEYSKLPEFSRAINSFIKATARGAISNIYVKVGTRPHGFHDKRILDSEARIEEGRDYNGIDLSILRLKERRAIFSKLVRDIAKGRLSNEPWFKKRELVDIKELLNDITPIEEAERYCKQSSDLHFKILRQYSKFFKNKPEIYNDIVKNIKKLTDIVLYQKFLVIEACRKLQRMLKKTDIELNDRYVITIDSILEIGNFLGSGQTVKNNSRIYYKLKDMREPALFLLASDFRQQKYYCGFKTMVLMSEGVPLNFIKICRAIFDELRHRHESLESRNNKIDISWQSRAIRKLAAEIRRETIYKLTYAQVFLILLDELGFIFRKMQLNPNAPYPSPNGFSIEKEWLSESNSLSFNNISNSKPHLEKILRDAIDWGYLFKMTHRSREGSLKTRTKFYINSMLAPYYDLSVRHLKEPFYMTTNELEALSAANKESRTEMRKKIFSRLKYLQIIKSTKDLFNK